MHVRMRCPSRQLQLQLPVACSSTGDSAVLLSGLADTAAPVRGPRQSRPLQVQARLLELDPVVSPVCLEGRQQRLLGSV